VVVLLIVWCAGWPKLVVCFDGLWCGLLAGGVICVASCAV